MNERSFISDEDIPMIVSAPSKGEQTRSNILQTAHDLFIKQGYHGTSMRQIAIGAHIALGGLYNHFSSKEQVFEAVFLAFHPYHEVLPLIASARGANLEQLVHDTVRRMTQVVEGRPDFMNLMFIEVVEFKSKHAQQLFAILFPQGTQIMQHFADSYPEQIRTIPSPMVVRTFLGLFFGYYLTEIVLAPGAPIEFREYAQRYFVDIYLHGILASESK
jgi:AcrR family transcriptional regulator